MKIQTKQVIDVSEWDAFIEKTYGRPYSFQQQDGCKDRGNFDLTVPSNWKDDYKNDTVPEVINHEEMGVSFAAWRARDPKQPLDSDPDGNKSWGLSMWWERNFYPGVHTLANDLHAQGLLEAGEYVIDIDW